jgi:hypothetical protein
MGVLDEEGAFLICSLYGEGGCSDISAVGNIAAGSIYTGFSGLSHRCGESATQ